MNTDYSPARSHKSHPSAGFPKGLYGKLIGRALDKPLTADTLAQYLDGKSVSSTDTTMAPRGVPGSFRDYAPGSLPSKHEGGDDQAMKMVRPPPGFGGATPRMITVEDRISVAPTQTPVELQYVPKDTPAFDQARRLSDLQSVSSSQHHGHARGPSGRRYRHRAHTRTKRTDQGPEPSHADIYPDDAAWVAPRERYQPEPAGPFQKYLSQLPPQRDFRVEEAVSWPTPAEVYTRGPKNPLQRNTFGSNTPAGAAYTQQEPFMFNTFGQHLPANVYASEHQRPPSSLSIFKGHYKPSKEDMDDADQDIINLIDEIPAMAQLGFSTTNLHCDERPLTPRQLDAKRYGLTYMGLGVGDSWNPPAAVEGAPFRVRPLDHEGWGGWEWAIQKGWGDE
jgi:hypothetical protein